MALRNYFYKGKKAVQYLRHFGPRVFAAHVGERLAGSRVSYNDWYERNKPDEAYLAALTEKNSERDPLISVLVPAYETNAQQLREMIASVTEQTYAHWELCLADASDRTETVRDIALPLAQNDNRILYKRLPRNKGIAENTNEALAMARGKYVTLLDHDDLLAPHALRCMADALMEADADMAYSDEDKVERRGGPHFQPHFKPDYNLDLLRSNNYITHLLMVERQLAEEAGGLDGAYDGAQDYDFILRCAEKARGIVHVPGILYHWRTHLSSTADNPNSKPYAYEAGRRAVEAHLQRCGISAEVAQLPEYGFYRVTYKPEEELSVSVIITGSGTLEDKLRCVGMVRESGGANAQILVPMTPVMREEAEGKGEADPGFTIFCCSDEDPVGRIRNEAARQAEGRLLLFLSDEIRGTKTPGFILELAGVAQRPDVGAAGARHLIRGKVDNCGYVLGAGGFAGKAFEGQPAAFRGYRNKTAVIQDISAVDGACLMIRREVFDEAGGFREALTQDLGDVDLCLRLRGRGLLTVYDPYASFQKDPVRLKKNKRQMNESDLRLMEEIYGKTESLRDPYYNPNLTRSYADWGLQE